MEEKEKVSVVVPVYNVQDRIKRCIDSALTQTYPYFELILVDDGSSDRSLSICREAEKKDKRIIVVSKPNGGVSSARNKGLDYAKGKYIMFLDSDDWLDSDLLSNMITIQKQENAGMVICGLSMHGADGKVREWYPLTDKAKMGCSFSQIVRDITMTGILNSPCNKLFLREKIQSRFNTKKSMGEDMDFNIAYIDQIDSIAVYWACPYHYDMTTAGSLTKQIDIQIAVALENIEHKEEFLKRHDAYFAEYENMYTCAVLQRAESYLKEKHSYHEFKDFYQKLAHEFGYKKAVCEHKAFGIRCRYVKFMVESDFASGIYVMAMLKKWSRRGR